MTRSPAVEAAIAETTTGTDLVEDMVKVPTLDTYFDRNPVGLTDEELDQFIETERERRVVFINKDAHK